MIGGQHRNHVVGGDALFLARRFAAEVDLERTPQDQRPRGLIERFPLHQHPADVGVDEQSVGLGVGIARFRVKGAALAVVLRVGDRVLIGDLGLS